MVVRTYCFYNSLLGQQVGGNNGEILSLRLRATRAPSIQLVKALGSRVHMEESYPNTTSYILTWTTSCRARKGFLLAYSIWIRLASSRMESPPLSINNCAFRLGHRPTTIYGPPGLAGIIRRGFTHLPYPQQAYSIVAREVFPTMVYIKLSEN